MSKIDEIEKLAKAASEPPCSPGWYRAAVLAGGYAAIENDTDARLIAAADPTTVLAMCEALKAARLLQRTVAGMVSMERDALAELLSETNVRCLEMNGDAVRSLISNLDKSNE